MNGQKNARKKINETGTCDNQRHILQLRILGNTSHAEIGSTIAIEVNNQIFAPIHDLCGNITTLINTETKKIQESYFYNAFGEEETFSDNNILNPWKFSSKRKDPETDLIFFGRRYYNPIEGRFCTPDPLGLTNSMNLYAFALNDPLMRIDLYGLMAILQYPLMDPDAFCRMEPYNTPQSVTPAAIDFIKGCYWGYNEVYSGNSLHTPITPAELYGQRFGRSLGMAQGISEMCMGTYVTAAGIAGQIGSGIGTTGTGGAASMVTVPVFAASLATTATGGMVSAHGYSMFKNAQNLPELKSGSSTKLTKNIKKTISIDQKRINHIFRKAEGHLQYTKENCKILEEIANDSSLILGKDKYGNLWAAKTHINGSQHWVQIRNNKIINGGYNVKTRQFNHNTGLAKNNK